jgi:CRISPR-associated protein Cas5h
LKGYSRKGEFPEYYRAFKELPVSIEPLEKFHDKGNFSKTIIKYTNTVGYANADGNLIVTEQTLVRPGYRCYILLDDSIQHQENLRQRLLAGESVYLPYLGKNEFSAWWESETVTEYDYEPFAPSSDFVISSLFIRQHPLIKQRVNPVFSFSVQAMTNAASFMYFERLPISFNETLLQYELAEFAFADWTLKKDAVFEDLFILKYAGGQKIIQLF